MALFSTEDESRLDWALLYDGSVTKYHKEELLESNLQWLRDHFYSVVDIDCSKLTTFVEILVKIGDGLSFPGFFRGHSLDAFDDHLYDIQIPFEGGVAIVLRHYEQVLALEAHQSWKMLNILDGHSRRNLMFGLRLIILLQTSNPELHIESVGAYDVAWNQNEFMDFQRGIGDPPNWWAEDSELKLIPLSSDNLGN